MNAPTITMQVDTEELVKSKFIETLTVMEGYFREAKGDVEVGQTYSANAVYRRMEKIKEALHNDLEKLADSIGVIYGPAETSN